MIGKRPAPRKCDAILLTIGGRGDEASAKTYVRCRFSPLAQAAEHYDIALSTGTLVRLGQNAGHDDGGRPIAGDCAEEKKADAL